MKLLAQYHSAGLR